MAHLHSPCCLESLCFGARHSPRSLGTSSFVVTHSAALVQKKKKVRVYFLLMKNCVDHLATRHGYTGMMTGCYRAYSTLIKFSLFRSSMAASVDAITHNEYNISHNLNQIQSRISRFTAIASLSYLRHLGLLLSKKINH